MFAFVHLGALPRSSVFPVFLARSKMQEKRQFLQRASHFGSSHFGSTLRYLFCRRACCQHVTADDADETMWMVTVSLVYVLVLWALLLDGVEWQWRQAGSETWWMVLVWHPSWGRVVSEASDKGRHVAKWEANHEETEREEAA